MNRKTVYFTAPRQAELREESLPALGADDVLVETICSAISAGTEILVYRGQFPHINDSHDHLSSRLKYPLAFGYACVGRIIETGKGVEKSLLNKIVFGFAPHTSAFIAHPSSLILAPASSAGTPALPVEACSFLPNMETAVNLIQDAAPILGERVLVLGQGVVGLLVASLLKEFPLEKLVTSDCFELRRKASLEIGVDDSFDPIVLSEKNFDVVGNKTQNKPQSGYAQNFDLTFELTGSPSALDDAIAMTAFSGRIVIGSWYGDKRAEVDLGGAFHRSRIKLISSQVSTIAPELSGRWDKARRFNVAWEALRRIQPQKWITHRFPIDKAEEAYRLLDENPHETIQVLLEYTK
ncbi:MAG TPA: zinc-binding alcohol dehydrogenase [Anaerolineales bacterium]|nr:zinc-binding alcohol dehydrogenase [Anaerolineales bacterium]HNS62740.1 zinc-binding alcohol dehydrogenase [Anaerolineales bacterium]